VARWVSPKPAPVRPNCFCKWEQLDPNAPDNPARNTQRITLSPLCKVPGHELTDVQFEHLFQTMMADRDEHGWTSIY
jgi:hypothetical protein